MVPGSIPGRSNTLTESCCSIGIDTRFQYIRVLFHSVYDSCIGVYDIEKYSIMELRELGEIHRLAVIKNRDDLRTDIIQNLATSSCLVQFNKHCNSNVQEAIRQKIHRHPLVHLLKTLGCEYDCSKTMTGLRCQLQKVLSQFQKGKRVAYE